MQPKTDTDERQPIEWPFRRPRGIAKDVFSGLGGGEAFLRAEREQFYCQDEGRARTPVYSADLNV